MTVVRISDEESKESIHLLFKMPSSKLRDATGGTRGGASTRRSVNVFTENPIVSGPRTSRPRKKLVEINTSDEDDDIDDQEEDEVDDDDAPGEDDEDADADGDLDMDDAPPQPAVSKRHAKASAATSKPVKSVEAKEMEMDDDDDEDDEELSEPDSDAEGEPDDLEESGVGNVNVGDEELEEDDIDEEIDSDDGLPSNDPAKMTKRQRGNLGNDFLQLPMGECTVSLFKWNALSNIRTEPQVKKHLTAEERQMRRAEMARRRKNLSEKRNEEEKVSFSLWSSGIKTIRRILPRA